MLPVYSVVKSTHLYPLAGNFLIWQVSTPCRPQAGRPVGSTERWQESCTKLPIFTFTRGFSTDLVVAVV